MNYINNKKYISDNKYEIINFLKKCNNDFPVSITSRVNINTYVEKVMNFGEIVLAVENNRIAGLIFFYNNDKNLCIGYVTLLCVDCDFRNQGIGKKLLVRALDKMKKEGMSLCELSTNEDNKKAINLYTGYGFEIYKVDKKENELKLRKKL